MLRIHPGATWAAQGTGGLRSRSNGVVSMMLSSLVLPSFMALWMGGAAWAEGCDGPLEGYLAEVREHSREDAYRCLADRDDAGSFLVAEVAALAKGVEDTKLTRALAIHIMQRLDRPVPADQSRALGGADRRFLRDAVHARRGRQSPVPSNARVFERFDWYEPDRSYTPARLTALDHANLTMIDSPPKAPKVDPAGGTAADAMAEAAPAAGAGTAGMCGCSAASGAAVGGLWVGLLGFAVGRRRSRMA